MIYVGGESFTADEPSSGIDTLIALLEHPLLVSTSNFIKLMPERKVSLLSNNVSTESKISKCVYLLQREFATVDPALVDLVGTDEATTCVGISIRNSRTGMISVSHMDLPNVVDEGLSQMLHLVADQDSDSLFDVHLIGSFVDVSSQHSYADMRNQGKLEGYSYPLCVKIIEALRDRTEKFQIQTLHVLGHNTRWNYSEGTGLPIFHGFVMETSTGSIFPASFDETSRCPDEIVRRIRVSAYHEDPIWSNRLLEAYDTKNDLFVIPPLTWTFYQEHMALTLQSLSDSEILQTCSSSPSAEGPDFVKNERRRFSYLIQHPHWRETFPLKQPRVFRRTKDGRWIKK